MTVELLSVPSAPDHYAGLGAVFKPTSRGWRRLTPKNGAVRIRRRWRPLVEVLAETFGKSPRRPRRGRDKGGPGPSELRSIPDHPRYYADRDGNIWSACLPGRLRRLRPARGSGGYLLVGFHQAGRARQTRYVHRLVAAAFIRPPLPGEEVRHLDGTRANAAVSNLAIGTKGDNIRDAQRHGRLARKLTKQAVMRIKRRLLDGEAGASIARSFGVCKKLVYNIRRGRAWGHVPAARGRRH